MGRVLARKERLQTLKHYLDKGMSIPEAVKAGNLDAYQIRRDLDCMELRRLVIRSCSVTRDWGKYLE